MTDDMPVGFADRYDLFFARFGGHDAKVIEFYRRLIAIKRK